MNIAFDFYGRDSFLWQDILLQETSPVDRVRNQDSDKMAKQYRSARFQCRLE